MPSPKQASSAQSAIDAELADPEHDAILQWAARNPETILRGVFPDLFSGVWPKKRPEDFGADREARSYKDSHQMPTPKVTGVQIACPIYADEDAAELRRRVRRGNPPRRRVGRVDLLIQYAMPTLMFAPGGGFCTRLDEDNPFEVHVDIFTTLPTIGELMRRINTLNDPFDGSLDVVIVSPDDAFTDLLNSQGIHFFHYTAGD